MNVYTRRQEKLNDQISTDGMDFCNDVAANSDSDDEFSDHIRKRTKRFYVGGFLLTITEEKIAKYVSKRGPKVTKVVAFQNRRNRNATIRLNVEDDANAHLLTGHVQFWPRGVNCRPWLSRNALKAKTMNRATERTGNTRYRTAFRDGYEYTDEDKYSTLDFEGEVD